MGAPDPDLATSPPPVLTSRAVEREVFDHTARAPEGRRHGAALCLSGGGFRATLFHLGALRRLNETGVLGHLDAISSVSGGSIASAFLAAHVHPWPEPGHVFQGWDATIAKPLRAFCAKNLRTGPIIRSLLPWNLGRPETGALALAHRYENDLTHQKLTALPDRPRFIFCATNMVFGNNWEFRRDRVGDYLTGYCSPPPDWTVGRAVAASSCFPPVFRPLPIGLPPNTLKGGKYRGQDRNLLVQDASLTDGGVYDNMGLEPVWRNAELTLVSDGGGLFPRESRWNVLLQLLRYNAIIHNQAASLRKRWLIASFNREDAHGRAETYGAYWGIGSAASSYKVDGGYSKALATEIIAPIRTDLDSFSKDEAAVLENHGYVVADAALRTHVVPKTPHFVPFPNARFTLPHDHANYSNEPWIRTQLANSHTRTLLGRR